MDNKTSYSIALKRLKSMGEYESLTKSLVSITGGARLRGQTPRVERELQEPAYSSPSVAQRFTQQRRGRLQTNPIQARNIRVAVARNDFKTVCFVQGWPDAPAQPQQPRCRQPSVRSVNPRWAVGNGLDFQVQEEKCHCRLLQKPLGVITHCCKLFNSALRAASIPSDTPAPSF